MEKLITTEDGLTLWSEAFGKPIDRPILLIMGAMNQGIFWPDEFCGELAKAGHYVIRYDHRDTGKSSTLDFQKHPYDLNDLTRDAVAVLHGHGVNKAIIVGLSMGGYIAQLMAVDYPDVVDRLILISTTADQRPYMAATMGQAHEKFSLPEPGEKLLAYLRDTVAKPPNNAAEMEENMLQGWAVTYGGKAAFPRAQLAETLRLSGMRAANPGAAFNHALAVLHSPERLESIRKIKVPTLIIHGKYDVCFPLAHGHYLAENIPKSQLHILEMGHSFMWSASDEVLSSILSFLTN